MKDTTKHIITGEHGTNPSLNDFLKLRGEYQYPTEDPKVYASSIAKMNLADLQTHAINKGIKPTGDRRRLECALVNQFKSVIAKRKATSLSTKLTAEQILELEEKRKKSIERAGNLRVLV
jgi:hypothetical protein